LEQRFQCVTSFTYQFLFLNFALGKKTTLRPLLTTFFHHKQAFLSMAGKKKPVNRYRL
jgi:hypothetical protein